MGANAAKAYPTPGAIGNGLGTNAVTAAQAPALQPNYRPMQPMQATQPLKPMSPSAGRALQPGQAAFPSAQTPMNPWGPNRGGSGMIPLYRRPGTMPEY